MLLQVCFAIIVKMCSSLVTRVVLLLMAEELMCSSQANLPSKFLAKQFVWDFYWGKKKGTGILAAQRITFMP